MADYWGDIIESYNSSENPPFKEGFRPKNGYLEITMNYPRTKNFLNATAKQQQNFYKKLWHNTTSLMMYNEQKYVFEYCKSGAIHLHGYVSIDVPRYFPAGAVNDFVKSYLRCLPRKYKDFKEGSYHPLFVRYRGPSICVQHRDMHNPEDAQRFEDWKKYIQKQQELFSPSIDIENAPKASD